jgi:N-acetylneuraminate synthase
VASRAAATYPYDVVPGPFIISNGMGQAPIVETVRPKKWMFLQCVSKYPTPLQDARWSGPATMGLSDHSGTVWPGLDAMARGCPMLEVHFAVPEFDAGNDKPVCLTIDQLKLLCEARDGFAALRSN